MTRKKLIVLISIFACLVFSFTAYAAFYFSRDIDGDASSGKIQVTNRYFYKYSYQPVTTGTYNANTYYYKYDTTKQMYYLTTVTNSSFTTDGSLYVNENNDNQYEAIIANEGVSLNLYANTRTGQGDEQAYPYFNQIGCMFNFKSSIDVYLRIEFKDAWKSQKTYTTTGIVDIKYIQKDKIEGESPFSYSVSEDWIFDSANDCVYYKYVIPATCTDINDVNAAISEDYLFRVNPDYMYSLSDNIAYREMIIIELSFNVSLVQANRAAAKWEVDLDALGISPSTKE